MFIMETNNFIFMGSYNELDVYTRSYGKKLFCYVVPSDYDIENFDIFDWKSYRVSSSLCLSIINLINSK